MGNGGGGLEKIMINIEGYLRFLFHDNLHFFQPFSFFFSDR